ncbi:hypothetical protein [Streptomyces canus]|uniref:hypothetical protein n=1 Tax=Streptomyces canus TaxID=58343 RepID=UPI00386820A6
MVAGPGDPEGGRPSGVAVDAGSPTGLVLPPVAGIVPDAVAVDVASKESAT